MSIMTYVADLDIRPVSIRNIRKIGVTRSDIRKVVVSVFPHPPEPIGVQIYCRNKNAKNTRIPSGNRWEAVDIQEPGDKFVWEYPVNPETYEIEVMVLSRHRYIGNVNVSFNEELSGCNLPEGWDKYPQNTTKR